MIEARHSCTPRPIRADAGERIHGQRFRFPPPRLPARPTSFSGARKKAWVRHRGSGDLMEPAILVSDERHVHAVAVQAEGVNVTHDTILRPPGFGRPYPRFSLSLRADAFPGGSRSAMRAASRLLGSPASVPPASVPAYASMSGPTPGGIRFQILRRVNKNIWEPCFGTQAFHSSAFNLSARV